MVEADRSDTVFFEGNFGEGRERGDAP